VSKSTDQRLRRQQIIASRLRDDGETYSGIAIALGITKKQAIERVRLGYRIRDLDELAELDQQLGIDA
jgi:hypothetical protein